MHTSLKVVLVIISLNCVNLCAFRQGTTILGRELSFLFVIVSFTFYQFIIFKKEI